MAGLGDSTKVIEAKLSALSGKQEGVSTLNAVNMLGWTGKGYEQDVAKSIWDGELEVTYADMVEDDYGEYLIGSDGITISKALLGGGKEGSAKLAAVMSHEGVHALERIRIEALAYLQANSTYNTINAMFGLEADAVFSANMANAIQNRDSWKVNTGNVDKWDAVKTVNGSWGWLDDKSRNFDIRNILNDPEFGGIEAIFKEAMRLSAQDDGLDYGIVSPGTLTPEIVSALSFPDLVFVGDDVSRMENGLMVLTPEQEANRRNDPSSMQGISDLIVYNRNHTTEPQVPYVFNQTMVEQELDLTINSACVLSSIAWLNNAYVQQTTGWGLNSSAIINSITGQAGKAYSGEGWVLSRNLIGQLVAGPYALKSGGEYQSESALKEAGYNYYTEERVHLEDATKKHTIAHANGVVYDPYTKKENRWWESGETSKLNRYVVYNTPGGNKR
jgi:hypothetical protein